MRAVIRLDAPVASDVDDGETRALEGGCDEQTSMAPIGIFFGAEDRGRALSCEPHQPVDASLELQSLRATRVVDSAIRSVELSSIWTAAELAAQKDIFDPPRPKHLRQSGLPELRCPLRNRMRSQIDEYRDLLIGE